MADPLDPDRDAAERLQLIAAGLAATGLSTRLHETPAGTDLTATLRPAGQREIEVVIDEDGYTEIRYWASPKAAPHQAVATIALVLSTITTIDGLYGSSKTAGGAGESGGGYDGPITRRAGEQGMSGSGDRLAGYERSPDPVRPSEQDSSPDSRSQPTDLQARLERLPVGHPSSPYRDDGSRKPPPPDLRDYELDLPDEQLPEPDPPDQDLPAEDGPIIGPDGSWDWRGRHLDPEQSRVADQQLVKCRDAEMELTPAMRAIEARLDQGHLVEGTERFALKGPDRFKEKFADSIARNPDKTPDELADEIYDAVRYTFIFSPETYCAGVWNIHRFAGSSGYELEVRRNSWEAEEYKGVNSRWLDPGRLNQVLRHSRIRPHGTESIGDRQAEVWCRRPGR